MGSHTAALREDYSDLPGARGRCEVTAGAVRDHVLACSGAGLQAGYHVIGDEAIDTVLAGFDGRPTPSARPPCARVTTGWSMWSSSVQSTSG